MKHKIVNPGISFICFYEIPERIHNLISFFLFSFLSVYAAQRTVGRQEGPII